MTTLFHRSTLAAGLANFRGLAVNARMSGSELMWALAGVAESTGVFSIASSGDGNAIVNTSGNVFTGDTRATNQPLSGYYGTPYGPTSPKIPRSVFNNRSHLTLAHASGDGELSLQNVVNDAGSVAMYLRFSSGGFNHSTATATRLPSPLTGGDVVDVWGTGPVSSPTGSGVACANGQGFYRVTIGVSDDATYPFLYLFVWGGELAGSAITFSIVWDTVARSAAMEAVDNKRSVLWVGGNPINTVLSPLTFTTEGQGWWGRMGTSAVITRMRTTFPAIYASGDLTGRFGRSSSREASPRYIPKVCRLKADAAPYGIKGRLRNVEGCLRNLPPLGALSDADTGTRYARIRVGDLLLPFNAYGTNGAGGDLPRV